MNNEENYGWELILDLHDCTSLFFNRTNIEQFFTAVCKETGMQKCELFWWDDLDSEEDEKQTNPQTTGTSAVQFILTSNITIHTLDKLKKVFINFFSCKAFNEWDVYNLAIKHFNGRVVKKHYIKRW